MSAATATPATVGRSVSVHKRFSDQRARLLALDYHDPFTAESLALVERLFDDLVTTTESYDDLQQREDQTAAELALSRAQLFPLKKENARLLRDNNLLHLKVIKAAEDTNTAERSSLLLEKRIEVEREEGRCLGTQKDSRISELEKLVDELRASLANTLDKHDHGGSEGKEAPRATAGVRTGAVREMEMSNGLPAVRPPNRRSRGGVDREEGAGPENNRMSSIVETLQGKVEQAALSLAGMEETRRGLEEQVEAREEEIARLGKQIGSDSNLDKVTLAHAQEANTRIVEQLNDQVDFLNNQLALREKQLSEAREESAKSRTSEPTPAELEVRRLQEVTEELKGDNARLTARAAELEGNLTAATTTTTGVSNHALEQSTEDDGGQTEGTGGEAKGVPNGKAGVEGGWGEGKGDGSMVEEVDLAVLESLDRAEADLQAAREEAHSLRLEVSRLHTEGESRSDRLDSLSREREELMKRLETAAAGRAESEEQTANGFSRERETEDRWGEEMRRRRATGERLSIAEDQAEFLAKEADAAREGEDSAVRRATTAEARAQEARRETHGLERALRTETERALGVEGEAAEMRDRGVRLAAGEIREGLEDQIEALERKLEASESARNALSEELERLAGRDSLLGVDKFAQSSRFDALERERARMANDLKAREGDVASLQEQKRALESEMLRAQRALSRGAVESASMAQGEVMLQARVEEAADDIRGLRSEVGSLTDRLLEEERKASAARDEADHLATRLSHRSAGFEGLEAEVAALRAGMEVARAEATEREGVCARMEAEAERTRSSLAAVEHQVSLLRETVGEKDDEIRRLKALARQLEGSRETLKTSSDEVHAALRDAELRAGQALAAGDRAKRDAQAARDQVKQTKDALAELDADRDRLQDTLDSQSERLAALREADTRWQRKLAEAEESLREEGSRCSDLEELLQTARMRADEASTGAAGGLEKIRALSSELEAKTGQLAAATEDLEMMAKENQAVTLELTRLGAERDDDRRKLGDALHQQGTAAQAARAAQFEKEDILKNYRSLHAEKRRLEAGIDELQLTRQRLTKSLAERDGEVSKLRSVATALEVQLQQKTLDHGALQRQAENLSAQLLRGGRQVEALAAENRRLVADARAQRIHANALLERIRSQQGHSTSAGQEVNSLRARLEALEEERDGLSHILGRERSHGTGLEQLIEASRLREASVAAEQRQLAREKTRLEAKAARLAEELNQARDCLADMSSRMSVSRREDASSIDPASPSTPASSDLVETPPPAFVTGARTPRLDGKEPAITPPDTRGDTFSGRRRGARVRDDKGRSNSAADGALGGISLDSGVGAIRSGTGSGADDDDLRRSLPTMMIGLHAQEEGEEKQARDERREERRRQRRTRQQQQGQDEQGTSPSRPRIQEAEVHPQGVPTDRSGRLGGGGMAGLLFGGQRERGVEGQQGEESSGVFDLEDVRVFVRKESRRLKESVRASRTAEDNA